LRHMGRVVGQPQSVDFGHHAELRTKGDKSYTVRACPS
jgi:hypothetical protein